MNMPPILQASGVTVCFRTGRREVLALQDVTVAVGVGERVGLVGESGSGKSTLARVFLGLQPPRSGQVSVAGHPLYSADAPSRKELPRLVQMVFQDPYGSLDPRMTIEQSIQEVLAVHRLASSAEQSRRISELLQQVGLDAAAAARFPHEFSGGQRQRIALARALAMEPRVLVADEPVSALDVSVQVQILNLMTELHRSCGLSLLLIAHDLAVVRYCCDRVYVMQDGRVVESGLTEEVLEKPRHPYTARLLSAVPDLDLALP